MKFPSRKIPKSRRRRNAWLLDLMDCVKAAWPVGSPTCDVHETNAGTMILPKVSAIQAAIAATLPGFSLYDAGATKDGGGNPTAANLGVIDAFLQPGTNMSFQDGVGPMPAGMGMVDGAGKTIPYEFPVGDSDTTAWLGFTLDNSDSNARVITSFYIDSGTVLPVPADGDDTVFYIRLGIFSVNGATKKITCVNSGYGIGNQVLHSERDWYDGPPIRHNYAQGSL